VALIGCPGNKNEEPITAAEALQTLEESTLESTPYPKPEATS
jgi:hypothetical protein